MIILQPFFPLSNFPVLHEKGQEKKLIPPTTCASGTMSRNGICSEELMFVPFTFDDQLFILKENTLRLSSRDNSIQSRDLEKKRPTNHALQWRFSVLLLPMVSEFPLNNRSSTTGRYSNIDTVALQRANRGAVSSATWQSALHRRCESQCVTSSSPCLYHNARESTKAW